MKKGLVSIVVPIYNMQNYLCKSLDSLLGQTYQHIEIILVNDGSTDNSRQICLDYESQYPEMIHIINKKNGGLSSARNSGIEQAMGEYITFPDPDDWVEPEYIHSMVSLISENNADLSVVGHYIEYDDKTVVANKGEKKQILNSEQARLALMKPVCIEGFAWNKLFRTAIINKNGLKFKDDVGTTEDLDFTYRYLKDCNHIVFDPSLLVYHYYQHLGGASQLHYSKKKVDAIHTYEMILQDRFASDLIKCAAHEEIFDTAMNGILALENSGTQDKNAKMYLIQCLKKNFFSYLRSDHYRVGRKIQAFIVIISPKLYCRIKRRRYYNGLCSDRNIQ